MSKEDPIPTRKSPTGASVLSRALEAKGGEMPPEGARFILNLGIRDEEKKRALDLLAKHVEPLRRHSPFWSV
ncbi:hypothetical protein VT85_12335 [Planctomyces sp. SH-PL62]|nr:hypothetical protein VT85_12335 [Planctomyces sp. SH-PL62]